MPRIEITPKTLEQLLKSWNPRLWIKEIDNPDVDSVMLGDKHLCSIPKGGKYKGWIQIMADDKRKESLMTSDGIKHRTMSGLVLTLIRARAITWDANKDNGVSGQVLESLGK